MFKLWILVATLANGRLPYAELVSVFDDVLAVAPDFETARRLVVWSWFESRWMAHALNPGGDCGVLQVRSLWWQGHTCAEIRKDRRLGFRLGMDAMVSLAETCGSMSAGLGAYASGKCGGSPMLVARRCALSEGC